MSRPFGKALGRDAMEGYPIYELPDTAKQAYYTLSGKAATCGTRVDGYGTPFCTGEATAWYADDESWFHFLCAAHIDLRKFQELPGAFAKDRPPEELPPVLDVAPPTGIDTSRFGKHYSGSLVPWLDGKKWRTIPVTTRRAHYYLFGSEPWCCDEASSIYWLGRDEGSGEDKWDYACGECVDK